MLQIIKKYRFSLLLALAFHVMLFSLVFMNWQQTQQTSKKIVIKQGDVINATAVSVKQYEDKIKKIHNDEKQRKQKLEKAKKAEIKRKQEIKHKQEIKRKKRIEKKRKAEQQRKAEIKKKEQLQRKKVLAKKKAQEKKKKELEKKRKKELKRKEELQRKKEQAKKKAAEKKKKQLEKKRQKEAEKRRKQQEQQRQAEIAAESARLEADRVRHDRGVVNRYAKLVQNKIERYWRQPTKVQSKMKCTLNIRMTPSGEVVSVKIVTSSGNFAFDEAAKKAVSGASPLPVPTDRKLFEKNFRDLTINYEK